MTPKLKIPADASPEARRLALAHHAVQCLHKFIDGLDTIVEPKHDNVFLVACQGALHFQLELITDALPDTE